MRRGQICAYEFKSDFEHRLVYSNHSLSFVYRQQSEGVQAFERHTSHSWFQGLKVLGDRLHRNWSVSGKHSEICEKGPMNAVNLLK